MKDGTAKLESGWLRKELERIPSEVAYNWSPTMAWQNGMANMKAPLEPDDAARLRDRMMKRYHEWTGRSLESDLADDRRS